MTYLILLILLCSGVLFQQLFDDSINRKIYYSLLLVLSVFLIFRYGQGTDYFGYKSIFNYIINTNGNEIFASDLHTEFGFKIIILVLKSLYLPFEVLIGLFAVISMFLTHKAIVKFVSLKYSALALLLLFPTVYLTYFYSGIRQGLVIALFISTLLPALLEKSYVKYYLICLFGVSMHFSSFLLLFVPLISILDRKGFVIIFLASVLFLALSAITDLWQFLYLKTNFLYFGSSGLSLFGLLDRLAMAIFIIVIAKEQSDIPLKLQMLIKIYFVGFCLAMAFAYVPLLSHRITAPLKALEIILVPSLFSISNSNVKNYKKNAIPAVIFVIILYCCVFTVKNIHSYIDQQNYVNTNILSYPYISVFSRDKILNVLPEFIEP